MEVEIVTLTKVVILSIKRLYLEMTLTVFKDLEVFSSIYSFNDEMGDTHTYM